MNFQMFKLDLEKAEESEMKLPTSAGSSKKRVPEKTSVSALLISPKPLTVDHNKLENSYRDGHTRPLDLPLEKSACRSGSKLKLDMEQQTGSKLGKEYIKAVCCHSAYLTYMQSTS